MYKKERHYRNNKGNMVMQIYRESVWCCLSQPYTTYTIEYTVLWLAGKDNRFEKSHEILVPWVNDLVLQQSLFLLKANFKSSTIRFRALISWNKSSFYSKRKSYPLSSGRFLLWHVLGNFMAFLQTDCHFHFGSHFWAVETRNKW